MAPYNVIGAVFNHFKDCSQTVVNSQNMYLITIIGPHFETLEGCNIELTNQITDGWASVFQSPRSKNVQFVFSSDQSCVGLCTQ